MDNFLWEQKKKDESIAILEVFITSNPDARELKRALAVKMTIASYPEQNITKLLGVSQLFIRTWKKAFLAEGIEGIKLGYQGTKGYLSQAEKAEIIEWLSQKKYWHLEELVDHLDVKYGVVYQSKQSYYALFSLANIGWKKSQKVNPLLNEELVEKKREEISSILSQKQQEIGSGETMVLFLDECHLLHGDVCGYVWGKKNIRLKVPIKNEKERQTYYGALNYQSQEFTLQAYPAGNGESTVKFIKHLQKQYSQKKLVLIWDGASYHKCDELRQFLAEVNQDKNEENWLITCCLFAPNAPEQNPVEDIWLQGKNLLRKYWHFCQSFRAVKELFELFTEGQKFDLPKIKKYQPASVFI